MSIKDPVMRETQPDVRIQRSRAQLMSALSRLMKQDPSGQISISALCTAAGVSRPTFYQHFSTVDDVLTAALDQRLAEVIDSVPDDAPSTIARFLADVIDDPETYRELLTGSPVLAGAGDALQLWLKRRLAAHFDVGPESALTLSFAAAGVVAAIREWLQSPRSDDVALADQIWTLVTRVLPAGEPSSGQRGPTAAANRPPD